MSTFKKTKGDNRLRKSRLIGEIDENIEKKPGNRSCFSSQLSFRCITINRQFFDDMRPFYGLL